MKQVAAAVLAALVVCVPLGFFLAAQWAADDSYSAKLAGTGLILVLGLPFVILAGIAAFFAAESLDSSS